MKKKILIVEDEKPLAEILKDHFSQSGYETILAYDGEMALEMIKREKVDVVLLDLILPKVDGATVLKELKADDATRKIPVIILSNLTEADEYYNIDEKDFAEYLVKSDWNIDDVVEKVNKIFKK